MSWESDIPASASQGQSAELRAQFGAIEDHALGRNLLGDPDFKIWPDGDSSAPAWWNVSGTGVTIARETSVKIGDAQAFKMTYGSATALLSQNIIASGDKTQAIEDALVGAAFSSGVWIYTTSSDCKVVIGEDATGDFTAAIATSAWTWVKHTLQITSAMDRVWWGVRLNSAGYVIVACPTLVLGPIPPDFYIPGESRPIALGAQKVGEPPAIGEVVRLTYKNPFIIDHVQIEATTVTSGQALIADANQDTNSMFSTRPQLAIAAKSGGAAVDGTYAYRCFDSVHGAGANTLAIAIDQAPTGGGAHPSIVAYGTTYAPPLQAWRAYNSYK